MVYILGGVLSKEGLRMHGYKNQSTLHLRIILSV